MNTENTLQPGEFIAPGDTSIHETPAAIEAPVNTQTEVQRTEATPEAPAKPKKVKAKKEPKAPVAIVCDNAGMLQVDGSLVKVQPRTWNVPLPAIIVAEPRKAKDKAEREKKRNEINGGTHQWDMNRRVSYMPVMPNLEMLRATGNAYPKSSAHPSVVTSERWKPFVEFGHAAYAAIKTALKGKQFNAVELMTEVQKRTKVEANADGTPTDTAWQVIRDLLRDCRAAGILMSNKFDYDRTSARFELVSNPEKIAYIDRSAEAPKKAQVAA